MRLRAWLWSDGVTQLPSLGAEMHINTTIVRRTGLITARNNTKPRMHAWTTGSMDTGLYFMVKSEYPLEVEHGPGRLKHAGWWCSSHDENHQGLVSPLAVSSQVALFIFHSLQGPVPLNFLHFKNVYFRRGSLSRIVFWMLFLLFFTLAKFRWRIYICTYVYTF